jgi:hypothetical protein
MPWTATELAGTKTISGSQRTHNAAAIHNADNAAPCGYTRIQWRDSIGDILAGIRTRSCCGYLIQSARPVIPSGLRRASPARPARYTARTDSYIYALAKSTPAYPDTRMHAHTYPDTRMHAHTYMHIHALSLAVSSSSYTQTPNATDST